MQQYRDSLGRSGMHGSTRAFWSEAGHRTGASEDGVAYGRSSRFGRSRLSREAEGLEFIAANSCLARKSFQESVVFIRIPRFRRRDARAANLPPIQMNGDGGRTTAKISVCVKTLAMRKSRDMEHTFFSDL